MVRLVYQLPATLINTYKERVLKIKEVFITIIHVSLVPNHKELQQIKDLALISNVVSDSSYKLTDSAKIVTRIQELNPIMLIVGKTIADSTKKFSLMEPARNASQVM